MNPELCNKYINKLIPNSKSKKLIHDDLIYFENMHKIQLSQEFKEFYLCFNGLRFKNQEYPITYFTELRPQGCDFAFETGEFFSLEEISPGIYPGDPSQIGFDPDSDEGFGWSPLKAQKYLWFGEGQVGSGYLLGIQPENFGKIYCWFSDQDELYNPIWFADSFFEFMDNFRERNYG
jgi:hypothetical protein